MDREGDRLDEDGFQDEDIDEEVTAVGQSASQHLWRLFEGAAVAIAQLYKERQQFGSNSIWPLFQESARAITALYQDSFDMHRKAMELGIQWGQRKRTKEILAWARRRRRNVLRRDDLVGFITKGAKPSSPARPPVAAESHASSIPTPPVFSLPEEESVPVPSTIDGTDSLPIDFDFSGGTGSAAAGQSGSIPVPAFSFGSRRPPATSALPMRENLSHDSAFARALATGRKRLGCNDVIMESPSPKRGRLT